MKRIMLMIISVIALSTVIGCNAKKESANGADGDSIQVDSIAQQVDEGISDSLKAELEKYGIDDLDGAIAAFFTEVFEMRYFEDDEFVGRFCTEKLQKKLRETCENCGEEEYAVWKFASEGQTATSEETKILNFVPEGNCWYKYEYNDLGRTGSHRIKFIPHVNPRGQAEFYIDDLE